MVTSVAPDLDAAADLRQLTADDIARNVRWYRNGSGDPTTWITTTSMTRGVHTPDGPATLQVTWAGTAQVQAWGPGAAHAERAGLAMLGLGPGSPPLVGPDRLVDEASRRFPYLSAGRSGDLYHALVPVILAQRITAAEAFRQWRRLVYDLGSPAPGPFNRLLTPPAPEVLRRVPLWRFHQYGIERKRAMALLAVARHADHLWAWADLAPADAAVRLGALPGIGPWTIGSVLGPACGDNDAVPIGDFHFPNVVAWNLAGEPRADDDRMLQLLSPYRGQRGRALRLILMAGRSAPAFGPKRRIIAIERL